jgi:HlyD family secretion protein
LPARVRIEVDLKMNRLPWRKLWWLILLPVLLLVLWPVVKRTLSPDVDFIRSNGTVEGEEVNITSKIEGRINRVYSHEGDAVDKGDILLQLADEDLLAKVNLGKATLEKARAEVLVASANVQNMQAGIDNAAADIRSAEADLQKVGAQKKDADRHLQQMRSLYKEEVVAREYLDSALTAYDAADAAEEAARAKVGSAKARYQETIAQKAMAENQLHSAQAGVHQAESDLAYQKAIYGETVIRSPLSGSVVYQALMEGEFVGPGMTILTIVDLSRLTVRIDLDESIISGIHIGSRVSIRAPGDEDHPAAGMVSAINRYADFATQKDVKGGRQDIRTFRVTVAIQDDSNKFQPGMTAAVQISRQQAEK